MSTPSTRGRLAGRDSHLRAGDADRERIATRLRTSHVEGRLDLGEFQQRLERCYAARTYGELGELVSDLPEGRVADERRPAPRRVVQPRILVGLVAILFVLAAVAGAEHHGHHPFLPVILLAALIVRLAWVRRARWGAGSRGGPGHPA